MRSLEEAIAYCEVHECRECILFNERYWDDDYRTEYEKTVLHIPCCFNLLDKECLAEERMKLNEHL